MSVNISIYNNVNARSQSITLSFEGTLVTADPMPAIPLVDYFFKFKTSARNSSNVVLPLKIVEAMNTFPIQGSGGDFQSANCSSVAYSTIKEMVVDYTYDYIYGHASNACGSVCSEQLPMKF
jgi:hypothetical protein